MDTISDNIKEYKFTPKQKKLLAALEECLGVVTQACRISKVDRSMFYDWKKTIPEFASVVEDIQEVALDFVENSLFERVNEKSDSCIIFYLKTKGKNRGYIERVEQTGKDGKDLNQTITVNIVESNLIIKDDD